MKMEARPRNEDENEIKNARVGVRKKTEKRGWSKTSRDILHQKTATPPLTLPSTTTTTTTTISEE